MTLLFRDDPYLKQAEATVVESGADGIRLDATLFYPNGGGQPGDTGRIDWEGGSVAVTDTRKAVPLVENGPDILHIVPADSPLPPPGTSVTLHLDWERRHRHMRMHTAMHLLCAVVPGAVTGGQVGAEKSRLDFDVPSASLDKDALEEKLNELIRADHPVRERTITDQEMAERPELVRTMSVQPPTGSGSVRLLQIGTDDAMVDLQPCGGTHVAHTGEIGPISIIKIENKGKQNRRVVLGFRD
ncbi:alanyl-tRNA editing protein [Niveispirillum sp. BGYR6]|uniref:alanyl-tRNA editing protein n=1 Tax=Niveispirillum sp. BGYR6 TaxID=2971249 RepID=UPI0022B98542|nr:alanyl-tRNA editing protein [Niveispirillum sp. BGYR6]MDG5494412.1 alanyl-tRNA editing protein [Niveispirillum sp. BGYR6]